MALLRALAATCFVGGLLTGCGAAPVESADQAVIEAPADGGLTGECATAFGDQLTAGFGRIDGVVYAVQRPGDESCTMPNRDHVIVQVLMNGAVYRLVVNVKSDRPVATPDGGAGDDRVRWTSVEHALVGPEFHEGWHSAPDLRLDYARDLDVHTASFAPAEMFPLYDAIKAQLVIGAPISVYAQSGQGRPESAHLIHRNRSGKDGAVVINPTTNPTYLVFQFAEQTF